MSLYDHLQHVFICSYDHAVVVPLLYTLMIMIYKCLALLYVYYMLKVTFTNHTYTLKVFAIFLFWQQLNRSFTFCAKVFCANLLMGR